MITGYFVYKGLTIMQHKDVATQFEKLILDIKPKRILEIGTSSGGLTLLLRDLLDNKGFENVELRTYDINDPQYLYQHDKNIDIRVKNLFNHQYDELTEKDEIVNFITQDGPTIVLCDGGSKINEFNILSHHLKKGDVIMAHDYSKDHEYFEQNIKNKIWNWCEITESHIQGSSQINNLVPYMEDEFASVVWVCKIKQ
jgi:predicted rRNA methylase YqxC with S4 and FtsJ domains